MMKVNKWTLGLAAVGLVSLPAAVQAEEKPNQLLTALSSTTISGYVDTSIHYTVGSGNATPPAYAFNFPSKQDGFNLNVVNVVLEKPLDEGTWSAGYKADLIFGPNAIAWNPSVNSLTGADSEVAVKQAYVALRAPIGNGIDLKLGTFDTIIGYEVFNAGSNPNYTRSWGYTFEPTQHTGLLGSYEVCKGFGISAGIANTWGPGINDRAFLDDRSESEKTWMAAATLTAPDDWGFLAGSALYLGIVDGWSSFLQNDVTSYYAGGTLATPIAGVRLGASFDYADAHDNDTGPSGYAESVALYASFQATEKLSFHTRGEWAKITAAAAGAGIPQEVISLTGTLQYDLWANVLSRLEVRWDRAIDGPGVFGGSFNGPRGFGQTIGAADDKDAVLVALNVIYKF